MVSVLAEGSSAVVWNFDTPVIAFDPGGPVTFNIDGDDPLSAEQLSTTSMKFSYPGLIDPGEAWTAGPFFSGITFQGGVPLVPASGITSA